MRKNTKCLMNFHNTVRNECRRKENAIFICYSLAGGRIQGWWSFGGDSGFPGQVSSATRKCALSMASA